LLFTGWFKPLFFEKGVYTTGLLKFLHQNCFKLRVQMNFFGKKGFKQVVQMNFFVKIDFK
jgi:hypothetical protein